jgi:predicted CopG family antitoxin
MSTIEIDFEVYKALTMLRENESTSYNDALRRLLRLGIEKAELAEEAPEDSDKGCTMQGINFPEGTQFRVTYKGRTYNAQIRGARWVDQEGCVRTSPSDAATAITRNNVNGWRFWWFKRPGDASWRKLRELQS